MDIYVEEKALKTSFCPEKLTPQVFCEDVWVGNGVSGDDLFVDGLLDFSNDDYENVFVQEGEEEIQKEGFSSASEQNSSEEALSTKDEFGSGSLPPTSELSVPMDELANLEWLSHFVEDSFSEFSLQHLQQEKPKLQVPKQQQQQNHNHHEHRSEPEDDKRSILKTTGFSSSVPVKARSKRSRTGGRVWSMGALPLTDSSSSSFSSSSSSSSYLIFNGTGGEIEGSARLDFFNHLKKPPKKSKKKPGLSTGSGSEGQRRCSHCGVQKTPQWRTGPMGAKTLCNACGVRFKSGRLLPEYRPACSPTFSSEVHSNNHRKVLEMRRKKETTVVVTQYEPAVQSF